MMIRKRFRSKVFQIVLCTVIGWLVYHFLLTTTISERQLKTCILGKLDPWDRSLKPYIVTPSRLECSERKQIMFVDNSGYIHYNESVVALYSLTSLKCVYRIVLRVDGDTKVKLEPEFPLEPPMFIKGRVFRVTCKDGSDKLVYDYLHINQFWSESIKRENEIGEENENNLSIIIFGIDSVSRSHALRNLPKSYDYLLKEFDAYDFEGYSKVGENTWPNLVPLLAGQSYRNFHLVNDLYVHVDSMPLLWYEKGIQRYATFFAEDRPDISTFNYVKGGFRKSPVDYFFRPYTLAMHTFEPVIIEPLGKAKYDCFGNENYFDIQLEYLRGFLTKYKKRQKFVYFWNNQVGHEDFTTLSRGDEPLLRFLKWMKDTNQTNNAIFVVLSDHGFRIGGASLTHAGRAENNRPMFLVHVPKHLKLKYPWLHETIMSNTQKLVSHYDTYQTILDLLKGEPFRDVVPVPVAKQLVRRNIFNSVPKERTCIDAGIEDQYCTCDEKHNVPIETPIIQNISQFIVSNINTILSKHQDICCELRLHSVTEATVAYSNSDETNLPPEKKQSLPYRLAMNLFSKPKLKTTGRYVILLHTLPGMAYFEGTVDYSDISPEGLKDHMTVVGEPSRLDRYGNQSHCIDNSFLRLFCYCKNYVG